MKYGRFFLIYSILLVTQVILSGLLDITQLFTLTLLPAMILCIPLGIGTPLTLLLAFASGFIVDFFSGGMIGLTCTALLPVALFKDAFLRICFDKETYSRIYSLSVKRLGLGRILSCASMMIALFLLIYVWIDGAGTRPFLFNMGRFFISVIGNSLLSIPVVDLLLSQNDRR